jgi:lipoate-protein ligase B
MSKGPLRVISLTSQLLRYAPSLQLQEKLVAERKAGTAPDTLLVVQVMRAS